MPQISKNKNQYLKEGAGILFSFLVKYRKTLIFLALLSVVSAVTNAAVPYLAGRIVDSLISLNGNLFAYFLLGWILTKITTEILDWRIGKSSDRLEAMIEARYLSEGFGKLMDLPLLFHKNRKVGETGDRLNRAASNLSTIVSRLIVDLAPQFLSVIFALIFAFTVNAVLSAVMSAAVLTYVVLSLKTASPLALLFRRVHRAYDKAYGEAYDALHNINEVKQATAEEFEKRKLRRNFEFRAAALWNKIVSIWQKLNFEQRLIITFTQIFIYVYAFVLILRKEFTIGELVMMNGYASMLFSPFVMLARNWQMIQNGLASLVRANRILSETPEIYEPKDAAILSDIKGEIRFKNVSFAYGPDKKPVLKNLNFTASPGDIVAIVGRSGVGKSTLVNLISRYFVETSGEIMIDDHPIEKISLRKLRENIAVVPQEITLFNDTIKANLSYGNFGAGEKEIRQAAAMAHIDEFIESLPNQYNERVGERGLKLSTGQKQRISIARAILRDPKILILDEPTSALDSESEKLIQASLTKLTQGRTTFIIAHRLSTVRNAAAILVLEDGKLAESGTHQELIAKNGIYRKAYKIQFGLQ